MTQPRLFIHPAATISIYHIYKKRGEGMPTSVQIYAVVLKPRFVTYRRKVDREEFRTQEANKDRAVSMPL